MTAIIVENWLWVYILIINLITLAAYWTDKSRARNNQWRIPNKILLGLAAIGGSFGALFAMYFFRHKTRTWYYQMGMPVFLILHLYLLYRML